MSLAFLLMAYAGLGLHQLAEPESPSMTNARLLASTSALRCILPASAFCKSGEDARFSRANLEFENVKRYTYYSIILSINLTPKPEGCNDLLMQLLRMPCSRLRSSFWPFNVAIPSQSTLGIQTTHMHQHFGLMVAKCAAISTAVFMFALAQVVY